MARQPRILVAGGIYHVFARANAKETLFEDGVDHQRFLEMTEHTAVRYRWRVLGYCLMGNHYHLLLLTEAANLDAGMRHLNSRYGQWRNRRHGRVGHVFQGRYGAVLVQEGVVLRWVMRYVARNPVKAGIVSCAADWPWSSHRSVAGLAPRGLVAVELVLDEFGEDLRAARRAYVDYVDAESVSAVETHPLVSGDDRFTSEHLDLLASCAEFPAGMTRPSRQPLSAFGELGRPEALGAARSAGYTMRELASALGCSVSTVHRRLRGVGREAMSDESPAGRG